LSQFRDTKGQCNILDKALENGVLFHFVGNQTEIIRMIPQVEEGIQMLDDALTEYEQEIG